MYHAEYPGLENGLGSVMPFCTAFFSEPCDDLMLQVLYVNLVVLFNDMKSLNGVKTGEPLMDQMILGEQAGIGQKKRFQP